MLLAAIRQSAAHHHRTSRWCWPPAATPSPPDALRRLLAALLRMLLRLLLVPGKRPLPHPLHRTKVGVCQRAARPKQRVAGWVGKTLLAQEGDVDAPATGGQNVTRHYRRRHRAGALQSSTAAAPFKQERACMQHSPQGALALCQQRLVEGVVAGVFHAAWREVASARQRMPLPRAQQHSGTVVPARAGGNTNAHTSCALHAAVKSTPAGQRSGMRSAEMMARLRLPHPLGGPA